MTEHVWPELCHHRAQDLDNDTYWNPRMLMRVDTKLHAKLHRMRDRRNDQPPPKRVVSLASAFFYNV